MSGTRSPFPKARVTEALIVAHGQPSEPERAERALAGMAAEVQALLPQARIGSATLAAPGALQRATAAFEQPFTVYPLFMAAGWFVTDLLRRRLNGAATSLLPPLGLDAGLVDVALACLRAEARARGWAMAETEVFLAAHGSANGREAARSAQRFARALRQRTPGPVQVGFIEEAPFVGEVIPGLGPKALCLPFFAANGRHVRLDLVRALAQGDRSDILMPPLGLQPGVPQLIARAIRQDAAEAGAAA
ncbi:MAG: cobalamin biosynthesis protein CbiX [Rhodobacteraceae bacterium]|nr:MAG: cobalamin biosynthesis protein CbiX [Paracoccaceae bacterium]